ncbi:uncharacterized protein ARMOST_20565 [Armillaria ostoyae]|uniref:Uncharacterized protein n=1 Tax=Armillaria ostoyae TaxID=47428 RepID=A0A284S7N3_ARMOS|nr:uncharacterized protein ARMOST_20565 [Armillaria ostoyae]
MHAKSAWKQLSRWPSALYIFITRARRRKDKDQAGQRVVIGIRLPSVTLKSSRCVYLLSLRTETPKEMVMSSHGVMGQLAGRLARLSNIKIIIEIRLAWTTQL